MQNFTSLGVDAPNKIVNERIFELLFYCGQSAGFQNPIPEPACRCFLELEVF
ncbi:hypothetical protein [Methanosarcina sp. UBA5]|uniref:hypothetical protein n=1 Tax=Methanosarcina sp. UBA5 TaxID=1915593 RepID=UPI0025FD0EDA|nr:hypothetical protein [Methanosarcina sp. UBA5]